MKYSLILLLIIAACGDKTVIDEGSHAQIVAMETPSISGGEPNLFAAEDGSVFLSWLEYVNDTTFSFQYATLNESNWSAPKSIATGTDWFVNWADFPSLVAYKGIKPALATHRLEMSAEGTYDYDVRISQSTDGGLEWTEPFTVHTDGVPAEHGFVSMIPLSEDRMFATWLDGRNTKTGAASSEGHDHGHGAGPMSLRAATFDKSGNLFDEVELDSRVCDCCQTSAAQLDDGVIVAYRNRTEDEIRDIAVVRKEGDTWMDPVIVYPDQWKFPACPVNGPVVRSYGSTIAVSWFAMNDTIPEVKVAFSEDGGRSFKAPFRIDNGNPLGRVDLVFISEQEVLASWVERTEDHAAILAIKLTPEGPKGEDFVVTQTSPSRGSGFPRMIKAGDKVIVAWTHVDETTKVKSAMIHI